MHESTPLAKPCRRCGREQPIAEFYLDRRNGRRINTCRTCCRERARRAYAQARARQGKAVTPRPPRTRRRVPPGSPTKICTRCGREKAFAEFYLLRRTGRRTPHCRACHRAACRRRYARDPARHMEGNRQNRRRNAEYYRAYYRARYRSASRRRTAARRETRRLRELGVVRLAPHCLDCGRPATDLHHQTYEDVVDVLSLCHRCHMRRHFREWRHTGGGPVRHFWEYPLPAHHGGTEGTEKEPEEGTAEERG